MPIYEYACGACAHELEEVQKFDEAPLKDCPQCGQSSLERKVSRSAFHLKGGGWYRDGYGAGNTASSSTANSTTPPPSTTPAESSTSTAAVPAPSTGGGCGTGCAASGCHT